MGFGIAHKVPQVLSMAFWQAENREAIYLPFSPTGALHRLDFFLSLFLPFIYLFVLLDHKSLFLKIIYLSIRQTATRHP